MIIQCSWLVLRGVSFRPGQGTLHRPLCWANSLGIAHKVLFANRLKIENKMAVTCDNTSFQQLSTLLSIFTREFVRLD